MPSLREVQGDFAAAMFAQDPDAMARLLGHCRSPDEKTLRGIVAYQDSILTNLAMAVQTSYPLIEVIVGSEFLAAAARSHARQYPSRSADLNRYGHDFAEFIECFAPAASLPYLGDVARLEWSVQQVGLAADAPPSDLSGLLSTAPDTWGELRFRLDPAHAVLRSSWPVWRLWEVNQTGYDGDPVVDFSEAQSVLVRRSSAVVVEKLEDTEAAVLASLGQGASLEAALEEREEFDLSVFLQRHITSGLIRGTY